MKEIKYDLICDVTEDFDGMTVKGVLRNSKGISTRLIRRIIHGSGGVFLNDKPVKFVEIVKEGDVIGIKYPEEKSHLEPENIPLDVLFEDDDMLAINKQPGLVVHPTKGHPSGTLANGIIYHMNQKAEVYKPRFVNRLDMNTSGVLLVGKNSHVQNDFFIQTENNLIEKEYRAIVVGNVADDSGTIDLPIDLEEEGAVKRTVIETGYPSITHYEVLERFDKYTFLSVRIETGRTHQIRVHLSHIGYPILGDSLYGAESELIDRQALHSSSLSFIHIVTKKKLVIEAPLPEDMEKALKSLT